jgi:antitoxin FitA
MASMTIRNLDEQTKTELKRRASRAGHSMEEEVRIILKKATSPSARRKGFGSEIHEMFKAVGGTDDLEQYPRDKQRPPPDFSSW